MTTMHLFIAVLYLWTGAQAVIDPTVATAESNDEVITGVRPTHSHLSIGLVIF